MFLPRTMLKLTIIQGLQLWPRPLNGVRTCVRLLFKGGYCFFHRAPCAATNQDPASIQINNGILIHTIHTQQLREKPERCCSWQY